jgi:hypothetical protein
MNFKAEFSIFLNERYYFEIKNIIFLSKSDGLAAPFQYHVSCEYKHVQYLEKAFDGLAAPFSAFLQSA